jgi:hypothetical protein
MIRLILVGFWACLTTLAAGYAVNHVRESMARPAVEAAAAPNKEAKKTREINVPKIRDGVVKGYVVAQFSYVLNPEAEKKVPVSPDSFIVDEAFRYIYDDMTIDFDHLENFDLDKMVKALIKNVNARLDAPVLTDVGVQEFTFLSTTQAKQRL